MSEPTPLPDKLSPQTAYPATLRLRLRTRRAMMAAVMSAAAPLALGSGLAGCGKGKSASVKAGSKPASTDQEGPEPGSLQWAVAGNWRASDRPRDRWRHPEQTLLFFGLKPRMEVVEFWPGKGFWTEILAPWLARNSGQLYAANFQLGAGADPAQSQVVQAFRDRFGGAAAPYGTVRMSQFGPTSGPAAPAGTADLALFMLTLNEWMAAGIADKAFRDAFACLRRGGILGIEQHRAKLGGTQDTAAADGYVQEPYVKQLAQEAGFVFAGSSEINANPKDSKDHPFGVWTLPPNRLSAPRGQPDNPNFNHARYDLIGESDRMTLKFRKP